MNESLANLIFEKPIHSLQLADIINYFKNEQRETNIVEFKSYIDYPEPGTTKPNRDKEKINSIIRTICAFLNSDGGLLIWGAPKGTKLENSKEETFQGELTPVNYKLEPDQFSNKISSEISPIPPRIFFQQIKIDENNFCYVIEVNKSDYSPHQFKGTYYMRLDGSTRPAPHHYVEALIKKVTFPKIEGYLTFGQMNELRDYSVMTVQLTIHNLSKLINEKNITYRILATGIDLYSSSAIGVGDRYLQADFTKNAKPILHYNIPFVDYFVLIADRGSPFKKPFSANIILTVWGELSPAIISMYELKFDCDNNGNTHYSIIKKEENVYLMDRNPSSGYTGTERIIDSNNKALELFEKNKYTEPLYKFLYRL